MKKHIILLLFVSLFALTSCDLLNDDSLSEDNIVLELPPFATYFLGLNDDLTHEQFSSLNGIESVQELDGDIAITIDDDFELRASGSRGGFAVGGFTPAILVGGDSDDDSDPLSVLALMEFPQIENAKEEDGKIVITIDSSEDFELRASGSRGGFAVGGFTPAIVFTDDTDDDMYEEALANLDKVNQVYTSPDSRTTLLLDPSLNFRTLLTASGSRGGFAIGGFTPAILWTDDGDDDSVVDLESIVSTDAIRSAIINDNSQLNIVIEEGYNIKFSASGSRGGFAVGGFTPAILITEETDDDNLDSALMFKNHSAIESYDINNDGSSSVVINKKNRDGLIDLFHKELTSFLDEMAFQGYDMEYTDIIYEEDLSIIEFIVDEEYVSRHDLNNDYYTYMYKTLEHYQYLFHLFSENDISYQFIVKYENKTFYSNTLYEPNANESS